MQASNLRYRTKLIKAATTNVVTDNVQSDAHRNNASTTKVMFPLPFINQKAADNTRRQLRSLGSQIGVFVQPVFASKKVGNTIKTSEPKPKIINEQCVVYYFKA